MAGSSEGNGEDDEEDVKSTTTARCDAGDDDDDDDDDHDCLARTRTWTQQVPIGRGLCPWAARSQAQGRLHSVVCHATQSKHVAQMLEEEALKLLVACEEETRRSSPGTTTHHNIEEETSDWWKTTLLICPHMSSWNESFELFDEFIKTQQQLWKEREEAYDWNTSSSAGATALLSSHITLVAFHPHFVRWRGLPVGTKEGDVLLCRRPSVLNPSPATLKEACTKPFGRRKVKVHFHDHDATRECYVDPKDCEFLGPDDTAQERPVLADNAMHRSPYPTIHLIRNQDLARLSLPDISRVKRKNMQRMARIGEWVGE
jgi:Protein of unknown function (DUF1415)